MKILLSCLAALAVLTGDAGAATSHWAEAHGGRLRLVAPGGAPAADGTLRAGIEIALQPGWKTYWRQPGDSGIPPRFDHGRSINVAGLAVDFPAPERHADASGVSIGYTDRVVLPVTITPQTAAMPVVLNLSVDYGLCKEICVPATAEVGLTLSAGTPEDAGIARLLDDFQGRVPVAAGDGLAVRKVSRDDGALTVEATLTAPDAAADLFVEGPPSWYLPPPDRVAGSGATAIWRVPLRWVPKTAPISGTELRFTLINGGRAVEQGWRLD